MYAWVFQVVLFLRFPHQTLYTHLLSPIRATCPAHFILLDLITRIIFGKEYRSLSSSLYSPRHSPVTSSLIGPHILLNTLFSNTFSIRSSVNVSDQFSNPEKTKEKITVLWFLVFTFLDNNFFSPGATTPIGGCILQPSSGL